MLHPTLRSSPVFLQRHQRGSWMLLLVLFCCIVSFEGSVVAASLDIDSKATGDAHQERRKAAAGWFREAGAKARSVVDLLKSAATFSLPLTNEGDGNSEGEASSESESLLESVTRGLQSFASPQVVGLATTANKNKGEPKKRTLLAPRGVAAFQQRRSPLRLSTGVVTGSSTKAPTSSTASNQRRHFGTLASSTPIADAHSAIFTTASQIISTLPTATTTTFCNDGTVGVELSSSTKFTCMDSVGVNTTRDAYYYRSATKAERANCTYVDGTSPQGKQCICSTDYMLFRTRPTFFGCLPRNFSCATTLLGLNSCRLPGYAEPQPDMDSCYSLSRSPTGPNGNGNAAQGSWRLSIQCSVESYINPAIYDALGAVQATPTNASAVWVSTGAAVDDAIFFLAACHVTSAAPPHCRGLNSCRLPGYAEPQPDMDSCYSLSRSPTGPNGNGNAAQGSWRLSIQCSVESYINPAIYDALGAVQSTPANASAVWVSTGAAVDDANNQQPSGTFAELSADLNLFPSAFDVLIAEQNASVAQASQPPAGSTRLQLTMRHPLVTYGTLELQFFDFNEPSRTDGGARVILPLVVDNASSATGMGAGTLYDPATGNTIAALSLLATPSRLWNISYNISTLPDHYFFAGRLYMEVGLLSPFGLVSRYSVAGLQIEIMDTVTPTRILTYSNKLSTSTVAVIAVAVACAIFIILVVAWKLWRLPPEEDVSVVGGRIRRAESLSNVKKDAKKKD
ncbi:membrane-associated protein, putative [Bodo saltans]|uniref:Membrane-associated protein, putative n=1 Tax=Bodo saltans TaxID=75058 RepID=A0A0S4IK75_BODSA|nr:membrane-associated protein, putative [Bodo saltans]|eukprot:CUF03383.1 membrane-associated protein, putative [Bodo saltans]